MLATFALFIISATVTVISAIATLINVNWSIALVFSVPFTFLSFIGWQILKYLDIQIEILTKIQNDKQQKTP